MKQSEALDTITKIRLAYQAMESACKRIDELKEENKNLKEALTLEQEQRSDSEHTGEPVAWRNAAIRVGEDLCSVGPFGYYDMTAEQWLDWALSVVTVHLPPQQRDSSATPLKPLTDEQIVSIANEVQVCPDWTKLFARAIEAAHGITEENT